MKILCLLSWRPGSRWLWDYLPTEDHQVEFAYTNQPKDLYPGYGKFFSYYPSYWRLGWQVYRSIYHKSNSRSYDVIVTWEANTALPLAFFRSLNSHHIPPLVVLNFVLKSRPIFDFLPLVRNAMHSIDYITCLSQAEIEHYAKVLKYPVDRCIKLQGPFRDHFEDDHGESPVGEYIFSAGRSHRDYATLVEAVRELPVQLIVNARDFNIRGIDPPPNVKINPFVNFEVYLAMLQNARFVVVPLHPAKHASGETFIMQAMTARKAVIASRTFSTAEIIEPGVNGLLVPPGDVTALRLAIQDLLEYPEKAQRLGNTARQHYDERWSFPVVAQKVDSILQKVAQNNSSTVSKIPSI
jgi:glycosyltransferase involved in cell wall biosynthesis